MRKNHNFHFPCCSSECSEEENENKTWRLSITSLSTFSDYSSFSSRSFPRNLFHSEFNHRRVKIMQRPDFSHQNLWASFRVNFENQRKLKELFRPSPKFGNNILVCVLKPINNISTGCDGRERVSSKELEIRFMSSDVHRRARERKVLLYPLH